MDTPKKNLYSVDEIHNMRVKTAERYGRMTPEEATQDFKRRVEEAEKTMEALRKEKRFALN
ncbi:MAG: hypothetical protein LBI38_03875 [Oscillospiraceae bacterium]|jgi:hypothetical protein|nr:hypothetical protein [Oscillospiraceae bacterium]